MQLCMWPFHIIKFCSQFCIFLTSQSDVDFGIAHVVRQIKVKKDVRLDKKEELFRRIEAGEPHVGISSVLGLSGPTAKYL